MAGTGMIGTGPGAEGGGDGGVTMKSPFVSAGGASSCTSSGAAVNSGAGSASSWDRRSRVRSGSLNSGIGSTCPLVEGC